VSCFRVKKEQKGRRTQIEREIQIDRVRGGETHTHREREREVWKDRRR
jgi:hypothetical protein